MSSAETRDGTSIPTSVLGRPEGNSESETKYVRSIRFLTVFYSREFSVWIPEKWKSVLDESHEFIGILSSLLLTSFNEV